MSLIRPSSNTCIYYRSQGKELLSFLYENGYVDKRVFRFTPISLETYQQITKKYNDVSSPTNIYEICNDLKLRLYTEYIDYIPDYKVHLHGFYVDGIMLLNFLDRYAIDKFEGYLISR
jgi:hypothetical protein